MRLVLCLCPSSSIWTEQMLDWSRTMEVGKRSGQQGYIAVFYPEHPHAWPNGYVYAHRVVMEQKLGRYLTAEEEVHHTNEDKHDNSPENLELETKLSHLAKHRQQPKMAQLKCAGCGVRFERAWNQRPEVKGQREAFCSRSCNGRTQRERQIS